MIRHFFLDKTNTIIEGSTQNVGLNPILSCSKGQIQERFGINIKEVEKGGIAK